MKVLRALAQDIGSLPNLPLKAIIAVHILLVSGACQNYWFPKYVFFYNALYFACILWAINRNESKEPLIWALLINILSIIFDIVVINTNFPYHFNFFKDFSLVLLIANVFVRIVVNFYILKLEQTRSGRALTMFGASSPELENPQDRIIIRHDPTYPDDSHQEAISKSFYSNLTLEPVFKGKGAGAENTAGYK